MLVKVVTALTCKNGESEPAVVFYQHVIVWLMPSNRCSNYIGKRRNRRGKLYSESYLAFEQRLICINRTLNDYTTISVCRKPNTGVLPEITQCDSRYNVASLFSAQKQQWCRKGSLLRLYHSIKSAYISNCHNHSIQKPGKYATDALLKIYWSKHIVMYN